MKPPIDLSKLSPKQRALLEKKLAQKTRDFPSLNSLKPFPRKESHPLSYAQRRLWFLHQMDLETWAYHVFLVYRVKGPLRVEKLRNALGKIQERHEIFRTIFPSSEGTEPQQVVLSSPSLPFQETDLFPLSFSNDKKKEDKKEKILDLVREEIQRPFPWKISPPWRIHLVHLGENEHLFIGVWHHILTDGWSLSLFLRELEHFYFDKELPSPSLHYIDFALWQRQQLQGEKLQNLLLYWKKEMKKASPLIELPYDFPRPPTQSYEGATYSWAISSSERSALVQLGKEEKATLFMVLLTSLYALLCRYQTSGQDPVLGISVANRNPQELENISGLFVNTLPLHTSIYSEISGRALLEKIRQKYLDLHNHQDLPFEKLVENLQPERNLSYHPLYQVMFTFQSYQNFALDLEGLSWKRLRVDPQVAMLDLSFSVEEIEEGLYVQVEYCKDLFTLETIKRISEHWQNIIHSMLTELNTSFFRWSLLSEKEREVIGNNSKNFSFSIFSKEASIPLLWEKQAQQFPKRVILENPDGKIFTYEQINIQANCWAHYLQTLIAPGEPVAIYSERDNLALVAALAILKAGGTCLPLDQESPPNYLSYILEDSQVRFIFTKTIYSKSWSKDIQEIFLDQDPPLAFRDSSDNMNTSISPTNRAYLIYTSGSTGIPKGVLLHHQSIVHRVQWMAEAFPFSPEETCAQKTSWSFADAIAEILTPLLHGIKLIMVPDDVLKDPSLFLSLLEEKKITRILLVPSLLRTLLARQTHQISQLSSLKLWMLSGEELTRNLAQKFFQAQPQASLVNFYGSTEVTGDILFYELTKETLPLDRSSIPLGYPLSNTQVHILDPRGEPCPWGVVGEIYASGIPLALGYWNRPELTQKSFSHSLREERLYKMGDWGAYNSRGEILFYGRHDRQVKLRGYRIELEAIEVIIERHPRVEKTVVLYNASEERLLAYIEASEKNLTQELQELVQKSLPSYMLPAKWFIFSCFPRTTNGKIDLLALKKMKEKGVSLSPEPPSTTTEKKLAYLWSQLLRKKEWGREDGFFSSGGHSLLAMHLAMEIQKNFGVSLPVKMIFQFPLLKQLAVVIDKKRGEQEEKFTSTILPAPRREYYDLSPAQKRMFILHHLEKDCTAYNITYAKWVKGPLSIPRLEKAFANLIARHESLRTSFPLIHSEPQQKIHDQVTFLISTKKTTQEELPFLIDSFIRPFDLNKAPLLRVCLCELNKEEHILLWDIHHIIADGVSMGIMTRELGSLYEREKLAPLSLQYKDFSVWQNHFLAQKKDCPHREYWWERFSKNLPQLEIPTDYPRKDVPNYKGDQIQFSLGESLTKKIKALFSENMTLQMKLLALYKILLYRYTGEKDITVGLVIAGRRFSELKGIVGMFVNALALRSELEKDLSFFEFLGQVQKNSLAAYEHQDYPFDRLVEELELTRGRSPLFDTAFVVQNMDIPEIKAEGLNFSPYEFVPKQAIFDLVFQVKESENQIQFTLNYSTSLFRQKTIQRMISHYQNLLADTVKYPHKKISELRFLSPSEEQQVYKEFPSSSSYFPDSHLIELFQEQAKKKGSQLALSFEESSLSFEESSLSYDKLDQESNRLAHYLRGRGLQKGERVFLYLPRSPELIQATLGVLKAGGISVPVEPKLPLVRMRTMLEEVSPQIVLSFSHYLPELYPLQWEKRGFTTLCCLDTDNVYASIEKRKDNDLSSLELWEYVAENAKDDIQAGGWRSSYTNEPFSFAEMEEYSENAYQKLKPRLHSQSKVLEIGCGSGLTMKKIAPLVKEYWGSDLSPSLIKRNQVFISEHSWKNVRLLTLAAHEIDQVLEQDFDLVILNSVVQTFPGHNYLRQVLQKICQILTPQGDIFIGDVMDQEKKESLLEDIKIFQKKHPEHRSKTDFSAELFLPRIFFEDLAQDLGSKFEFSEKIGAISNELTRFRYDLVLSLRPELAQKETSRTYHRQQNDQSTLASCPSSDFPCYLSPEDTATLIFTSGSTGKPKAVQVTHRNIVRLVKDDDFFRCSSGGRILHAASPSFDASLFEIWLALTNGFSLHFVSRETLLDSKKFDLFLKREKISLALLTTPLFHRLAQSRPQIFQSLRTLLVGGDALSAYHAQKVRQACPDLKLINAYGPTENGIISSVYVIDKICPKNPPLGRPIACSQVHVINQEGQLVPVGVVGEICLGGKGLTPGYWNQPSLNEKKFFFPSWAPRERFYKTGDYARWLEDGNLQFEGRKDEQIKIRGFRVELREIEEVLRQHKKTQEVAIIVLSYGETKYLCACITSQEELERCELLLYLENFLPEYMIPSQFFFGDELPKTARGKIDKEKLSALIKKKKKEEKTAKSKNREAQNSLHNSLREIWQDLLCRTDIKPDDDFFALGGHSLLAVSLLNKIEKRWNCSLSLGLLFQNTTLEKQSALLHSQKSYSPLVNLSPSNLKKKPILFCIHPPGGNVLCYQPLAKHLANTMLVYALEEPKNCSSSSLVEKASSYLKYIRETQLEGPYFLGGWSGGGVIAFEMAQQLKNSGEEIALLAVLESTITAPKASSSYSSNDFAFAQVWSEHLYHLITSRFQSKTKPGQKKELGKYLQQILFFFFWKRFYKKIIPSFIRIFGPLLEIKDYQGELSQKDIDVLHKQGERIARFIGKEFPFLSSEIILEQNPEALLSYLIQLVIWSGHLSQGNSEEDLRYLFAIYQKNLRLLKNYGPEKSYLGEIHLFWTGKRERNSAQEFLGWDCFVEGKIHLHHAQGNHFDMLKEPNVKGVAEELKAIIQYVLQ